MYVIWHGYGGKRCLFNTLGLVDFFDGLLFKYCVVDGGSRDQSS